MLGPSGFFLPTEPGNTDNAANDIELIHISEDGFNELYRVCRKGRLFVYKALRKELRGNILYEELLDKDFNIGFSLNHSNICQYYAKIAHPTIGNCIVMEWIDGCTLKELLCEGNLNARLSKKVICELCDALDYMHRKQVIHRDLKPENIMVTYNGQNVKIIDFGLSDADSYMAFKEPAGTRAYAAPELISGEKVDGRSDIWSLGVIIREMSRAYDHVASGCLHRDVDKRYGHASEVRTAVIREPFRKARNTVAGTIALIILATGVWLTYTSQRAYDRETAAAPNVPAADTLQPEPSPEPVTGIIAPMAKETMPEAPQQDSDEILDAAALDDLLQEAAELIL